MPSLTKETSRADILRRLRRAEGQLRAVQRMLEEGAPCMEVAQQFSAARKALDSTYVRMTVCLLEQELQSSNGRTKDPQRLGQVMADVKKLLMRMN
jgi:DNA-binding FrmR family transcriptional regulator